MVVVPRHSGRRAALLLEVVVAFAILTAAIGLLAAQLSSGLDMTTYSEEQLEASLLADRILAQVELDPNMQQDIRELDEEGVLEDAFGDAYPGWFWRVAIEPVEEEVTDLFLVNIQVLYQRDPEFYDAIDDAEVMRHLALLRAAPARIDLVEDAGLNDQMIDQLQQNMPFAEFDPRAVDLHQLVSMDPEAMLELVPLLMSVLAQVGGSLDSLAGLATQGGVDQDLQGIPPDAAAQLQMLRDLAAQAGAGEQESPAEGGSGGRGRRGGQRGSRPEGFEPGEGSGPGGEYTLDDLIRMRDAYERSKGEGG